MARLWLLVALICALGLGCSGGAPPAPPAAAPPANAAASPTGATPAAGGPAAPAAAKAAAPTPAPTCKDAKATWKVAAEAVRPNQGTTWADRFKELIEQRTNCQLSILIFQGSVLGSGKQTIEQVRLGTLEMAMVGSDMPELYPPYGALDLPFIFRDRAHAVAVLDGPIGKALNEDLIKSKGVRSLGYGELGIRQVTNSVRPIHKPDDFKGLKIRVPPNKLRIRTFEIFGAAAPPIPSSEMYTALQAKVADGQENPLSSIFSFSFWEVQKYISLTGHIYSPVFPLINERTFQKLSPELQKLVLDTAQEMAVWHRKESERVDAEFLTKLQDKGMVVNEVNPADFQRQAAQVWAEFAAPIGQELIDSIAKTR